MPRCLFHKEKYIKKYRWQMGKFSYCIEGDDCYNALREAQKKESTEKANKDWDKRKKVIRVEVKKTEYKGALQAEINKLARNIDSHFNYTCIDCPRVLDYHLGGKTVNGAHFNNVGSHETIRFNLHNIHASTMYCNKHNTNHKTGYEEGLKTRYSLEYFDYVKHSLKLDYQLIKLSGQEVFEALTKVRKINREYKDLIKDFKDGREARTFFNDLLDIY